MADFSILLQTNRPTDQPTINATVKTTHLPTLSPTYIPTFYTTLFTANIRTFYAANIRTKLPAFIAADISAIFQSFFKSIEPADRSAIDQTLSLPDSTAYNKTVCSTFRSAHSSSFTLSNVVSNITASI